MAEKMYFGVLESIQEIPAPKTGMSFTSETDTEVTELVSGGRSVYRAPTAYKSFNMSWSTSASKLSWLIALYNGQFGAGPFYMTDPNVNQVNVLPARWSNGWQLAHQSGGWCRPTVSKIYTPTSAPQSNVCFTNRQVTFTQLAAGSNVNTEGVLRTRVIRVPGKAYYFTVDADASGGAGIKVRGYNKSTGAWSTLATVTTFYSISTVVLATDTNITMLEVDIFMPLGSTLNLRGMALGTEAANPNDWMPMGTGVGPVQFSSSTNGQLVSTVIDRIGLSLDFTEVESVEG